MVLNSRICESTNTLAFEQESFWDFSSGWTPHKIGWTISGACGCVTTLITLVTLTRHAINYQLPREQRQAMRIIMMPCVYGLISFFSYRYFREFTYFELAQTAYEGITISAFLLLLVEMASATASSSKVEHALARKEKLALPMTFGKLRFRPTKPAFIHILKWSVLQYAIFRPLISLIGIICEALDVLCPDQYSIFYAEVYLVAFDFIVISVALYGLFVFYEVMRDELKGRQPLSKFLSIKCIIGVIFYQSFVFSTLQSYDLIQATELWTATNVADGLNALVTSIEMVFFAIWMAFAFSPAEYSPLQEHPRSFKRYLLAIWEAAWLGDFAFEIWTANRFFFDYVRRRPGTSSRQANGFDHRLETTLGATSGGNSIPMALKEPAYLTISREEEDRAESRQGSSRWEEGHGAASTPGTGRGRNNDGLRR